MHEQTETQFQKRIEKLEQEIRLLKENMPLADKVTLVVFSGEQDKVLAALLIASAAAALEMETSLFFTFWGISALKEHRACEGKEFLERLIDCMTPTGPGDMGISHMNLFGAGAAMLEHMMKGKNVLSADEFLVLARDSGVKLYVCSMSMEVMGIDKEQLVDGIEIAGVATYLQEARRSGITLFI